MGLAGQTSLIPDSTLLIVLGLGAVVLLTSETLQL